MSEEMLPVLTDELLPAGTATRSLCHDGHSFLLHPVVHLHIVRGNEIMLQKRSANKKIQPGKWDTCVGGHISAGESVETALQREAFEEIGIDAAGARFLKNYIFRSDMERELINIFILEVGRDFNLQVANDEVDEVRFWPMADILNPENTHLFTPNLLLELHTHLRAAYGNK